MHKAKQLERLMQCARLACNLQDYVAAKINHCKISPFDRYRNYFMAKLVLARFPKKVLEVGCNIGLLSESYSDFCSMVVLSDYDNFFLRGARLTKHQNNIKFVSSDLSFLAFKDEAFDTVIVLETLEHLPKYRHQNAITEISRVVRSGGSIFISTPNRLSLPAFEGKCLELFINGYRWNAWDETHEYIYSSLEFIYFLKNFKNIRLKKIWGYYFLPGSIIVRMPMALQKLLGRLSYLLSRAVGSFFPLKLFGFTTIIELNKT